MRDIDSSDQCVCEIFCGVSDILLILFKLCNHVKPHCTVSACFSSNILLFNRFLSYFSSQDSLRCNLSLDIKI